MFACGRQHLPRNLTCPRDGPCGAGASHYGSWPWSGQDLLAPNTMSSQLGTEDRFALGVSCAVRGCGLGARAGVALVEAARVSRGSSSRLLSSGSCAP
ncbi:hypothetical protein QJS66_04885 [Kocuria rhizophila]|nr:hypothetical protein QJS66_04885 [Kocuria rhizophila]